MHHVCGSAWSNPGMYIYHDSSRSRFRCKSSSNPLHLCIERLGCAAALITALSTPHKARIWQETRYSDSDAMNRRLALFKSASISLSCQCKDSAILSHVCPRCHTAALCEPDSQCSSAFFVPSRISCSVRSIPALPPPSCMCPRSILGESHSTMDHET